MKIKIIAILVLTAILMAACSLPKTLEQSSKTGQVQQTVPTLNPTKAPVQGVKVESTQSGGSYQASLPGLSPILVISQIEGYGFVCTLPELNNGRTTQYCDLTTDDYQFTVTIWGQTAESVDLIEAVAFYYGALEDYSGLTAVIFGNIAGLTYQGSLPAQAKAWVLQTIPSVQAAGDEGVNTFGGVHYYIYAMPSIQVLEIGHLQK